MLISKKKSLVLIEISITYHPLLGVISMLADPHPVSRNS